MTPDVLLAEEINVPEVRVIPNTPVAPASPRPAARPAAPAPAPAVATPARPAAAPARPAASPPISREPAAAPLDPALIEIDKVPANVQTLGPADFEHEKAPDLLDAISRRLPGIALGDQTGNEFQRDLNYRGFVASPVIGTPQGLAVYQNGVRVNEVFGDIVNWDFIPETASIGSR
jgi:iron complex outermembrane receptor protein